MVYGRCTYRNSNDNTRIIRIALDRYLGKMRLASGKRRHDYPDAKVETERGVPHSLRRRRNLSQLSAEARERADRDRRKRRLDSESAEEKDTRLSSETLSK